MPSPAARIIPPTPRRTSQDLAIDGTHLRESFLAAPRRITVEAEPALAPDVAIAQEVATTLPPRTEAILQLRLATGTGTPPAESVVDTRLAAAVGALPVGKVSGPISAWAAANAWNGTARG